MNRFALWTSSSILVLAFLSVSMAAAEAPDYKGMAKEICSQYESTADAPDAADEPRSEPLAVTLVDEVAVGDAAARAMLDNYDVSTSRRLEEIGSRVAHHCDRRLDFRFHVVKDEGVYNAYSLSGGHIYVTEEMLKPGAFTDDELASILGHEIAHAALRHVVEGFLDEGVANWITSAICQHLDIKNKADAQSLVTAMQAFQADMSAKHQHRELTADQFGVLYSLRAGYDPGAGATALEKLARHNKEMESFGNRPEGMPTHPPSDLRIDELRKGEEQLRRVALQFDDGQKAFQEGRLDEAAASFKQVLVVFPQSNNARVNYGAALHGKFRASRGSREPAPALLLAEDLEALWRRTLKLRGGPRGGMGADKAMLEAARLEYERVLEADPENRLARNNLGAALADQDHLDDAIAELKAAGDSADAPALTWKNLGIALQRRGEGSEGAEARRFAEGSRDALQRYLKALGPRKDPEAESLLASAEDQLAKLTP